jgi:hypothetical protein
VLVCGLLAVLGAYSFAGIGHGPAQRFVWVAPLAGATYFAAQLLWPRSSLRLDAPLSPLNWALYVFALQLVVMPLLVLMFGAELATFPRLARAASIEQAMLISTGAFVCFALGAQLFAPRRGCPPAARSDASPGRFPLKVFAGACIAAGVAGALFKFRDARALLEALSNPAVMAELAATDTGGSLTHAASLFLRPFFIAGAVAAWAHWLEGAPASPARRAAATLIAAAGVVAAGASYSFNRSAFFVPLVAMAAAYSLRVSRVSVKLLAVGAPLAMLVGLGVGAYRWNTFDAATVLGDESARRRLVDQTSVLMQVQMYGQAPQFLGFLLEEAAAEHARFRPSTLLASALSPVPLLGKPYRGHSGVAHYNRLIYGNTGTVDQPIPMQGELYLAMGPAGLAVGFLLLGAAVARLDLAFRRARSVFDAYVVQFTAIWLIFLAQGGIGTVSQIFIYFFGPIYAYLIARWALSDRGAVARADVSRACA